jgi:hypothetical protein
MGSLGLVALSALPAQAADTAFAGRSEIAGGYSYVNDNNNGVSTSFPVGWFFSAGAHINDGLAVVGDISGNYKTETVAGSGVTATASAKVHAFLAGPRMIGRAGRLGFYGQFLVGAAKVSAGVSASGVGPAINVSVTDTQFCFAPGAGVDIPLSSASAIRVGMNERLIRSNTPTSSSSAATTGSWGKEFQLQIGLVFGFGQ